MFDYEENDRAVIGGNEPPDQFALRSDEVAEFQKTTSEWLNRVQVIEDQEQADQLGNFIAQLRNKQKEIEDDAKAETGPLYQAYTAMRDKWKAPYLDMGTLIGLVKPLADAWLKKLKDEQARVLREKQEIADRAVAAAKKAKADAEKAIREAEEGRREFQRANTAATVIEAERLANEAAEAKRDAERAEAAKPAMGGGNVGGRSRAMHLRKGPKQFEIVDLKKAIAAVLKFDTACLDKAIIDAAKRMEKAFPGKDIPGVAVMEGEERAV